MMKNNKLAQAKTMVCKQCRHVSGIVLSLTDVERRGIGTMAVDAKWRLYFDPKFVEETPSSELEGAIFHECLHLWLKHHKRAAILGLGGTLPRDRKRWRKANIAMDAAINPIVLENGFELPSGCVMPDGIGMPDNKSFEHYFSELCKQEEDEDENGGNSEGDGDEDGKPEGEGETAGDEGDRSEDGEGGGKEDGGEAGDGDDGEDSGDSLDGESKGGDETGEGGEAGDGDGSGDGKGSGEADGGGSQGGDGEASTDDGAVDDGAVGSELNEFGGSCADGIPRPWEIVEGSEEDAEAPGLDAMSQEQQIRRMAESIGKDSMGNGGGGRLRGYVDDILEPKMDPRRVLMAKVRRHLQVTNGMDDWSYRRPSRRTDWGSRVVKPSMFSPVPNMTIIVDTSGSMGSDDLAKAMGFLMKVVRSLRLDGVKVVCGDAEVAAQDFVKDVRKYNLRGGGGTNMGRIIERCCDEKPRPDLVVCVTDGYTPWCGRQTVPVVVVLTRKGMLARVPSHFEKVEM